MTVINIIFSNFANLISSGYNKVAELFLVHLLKIFVQKICRSSIF